MKIRQLLERDNSTPATVEYELEYQRPDGEWDSSIIEINGRVHTEHDPYNTGDSPAQTTFEPVSAYDKTTGKPFDLSMIKDQKAWDWISQQAAEQAGN